MDTPIYDFVTEYANSNNIRMHMPAHKGRAVLGCEKLDITEIDGADVLGNANGIIAQSERNATTLFSSYQTYYTTEGSTCAIKAMITLANYQKKQDRLRVLAFRNAHKAFVYAMAMVDGEVEWIGAGSHICECKVETQEVEDRLKNGKFDVLYITSPDYLGNIANVKEYSAICKKYGVLLVVDNAHGAYLNFIKEKIHPLVLGADMCCDSAHKTLPVLTGGAYLHINHSAKNLAKWARGALAMHSSTSPSYLILQSLDKCNVFLEENCKNGGKLKRREILTRLAKEKLAHNGWVLWGNEPLKITLDANAYGYTGFQINEILKQNKIVCEYYDDRFLVLMISASTKATEIDHLVKTLCAIQRKSAIKVDAPQYETDQVLSIKDALFAPSEIVNIKESENRICASVTVSCPPAIPIVVSGERITKSVIDALEFYGVNTISVVMQ